MAKIKVTFIIPIFEMANAGSENFAYRLVTSLRDHDLEIGVITNRGKPVDGIDLFGSLLEAEDIIKKRRPDVLIDWGLNYPADIHRLGGGVHRFFLEYSLDAYKGIFRFYKWIRNRLPRNLRVIKRQEMLIRRESAIFLPNSKFSAGQLLLTGAKKDCVNVLYNAVDTDFFRPASPKKKLQLRSQFNLSQSDILVLFVAHNLLLKNYTLLRTLFAKLKMKNHRLKLLVVGKRRPKRPPPNCFYLGEVTDMVSIYQLADLLVHPTYFDSCSNVVLEAMSCGLPVVVSDRCGAHELIQDGVSGYVLPVVPNGDPKVEATWFEKIEELANDKVLREYIGSKAREVMLRYDFKDYVEQFKGIILAHYGSREE